MEKLSTFINKQNVQLKEYFSARQDRRLRLPEAKFMRKAVIMIFLTMLCVFLWASTDLSGSVADNNTLHTPEVIKLPEPKYDSNTSIEMALHKRRSVRDYTNQTLTLAEVSQLLWAAQGITDIRGFRTAPSAGGLYPLEVYVIVGDVNTLSNGIYKYNPHGHALAKIVEGDKRAKLCHAANGQTSIQNCSILLVISAFFERTTAKYGKRGVRYVHMETGHAAQNVCLQAVSLNLGTVTLGAFNDEEVKSITSMPDEEEPLYLIAVGRI
jgi:SagB-type dehydrogenase family enzyme